MVHPAVVIGGGVATVRRINTGPGAAFRPETASFCTRARHLHAAGRGGQRARASARFDLGARWLQRPSCPDGNPLCIAWRLDARSGGRSRSAGAASSWTPQPALSPLVDGVGPPAKGGEGRRAWAADGSRRSVLIPRRPRDTRTRSQDAAQRTARCLHQILVPRADRGPQINHAMKSKGGGGRPPRAEATFAARLLRSKPSTAAVGQADPELALASPIRIDGYSIES
jgi:hypothetical protein